MDQPREKFATKLTNAIRAKNYTQEQVAAVARILPNSFRTKISRNTFTKREATILTDMLGIPMPDEKAIDVGGRWEKELPTNSDTEKTLAQVIQDVDKQRRVFDGHRNRLADRLINLVEAMREDDLVISVSSTVTPLEFEREADEAVTKAIALALTKGAKFVYFRPDEGYLDAFIEVWRYDKVPSFRAIGHEVEWFRGRLVANLTKSHQVSDKEAERLAKEHIIQLFVSQSPFFAAGFSMAMFHTTDLDSTTLRRMTIRLPGSRGAILQPAEDGRFVARFTTFAIEALRALLSPPKKPTKDQLKVSHLDPNWAKKPALLMEILDKLEAGGAYA